MASLSMVFAQLGQESEGDKAAIPAGRWAAEVLFWANDNLDWFTSKILWPFSQAFDRLIDRRFETLSPWWLVVAVLVVCLAKRQVPEAAKATVAMALTIGLGNLVARAAAETFVSLLVVLAAVAVVAVPLGLAGRRVAGLTDAKWVLERLALIHPWLLSLPMVFLFGIGNAPSLLLAAFYATPIAIFTIAVGDGRRSTGNLLLRSLQKAVLPALWIHAFMSIVGGGGLGLLIFRGLNNLAAADAFSAGFGIALIGYALQMVFMPMDSRQDELADIIPTEDAVIDPDPDLVVTVPLTPKD